VRAVTVFACESQPIAAEGLSKVLDHSEEFTYLGSAPTLSEGLSAARDLHPDVMLIDPSAGLKTVFQFIADVRNSSPHCYPILWVNELSEVDCFRALQLGARGVLKKTLPLTTVVDCLRSVGQGNIWIEGSVDQNASHTDRRSSPRLTPREREIVQKVCGGLKNKEIAAALTITAGTVKVHLMHIFEKTGVKDRFELAIQGRRFLGLDHPVESIRLEHAS
jgi:two-component system nitrate/nitrite response regulator NarL